MVSKYNVKVSATSSGSVPYHCKVTFPFSETTKTPDFGLLVSCAKEETLEEEPQPEIIVREEQDYPIIKAQMGTANVIEIDGSLYFDLSHSDYTALQVLVSFVNELNERILLLRINETDVVAFDNCRPHRGTRSRWSYSNNKFEYNNHENIFGIRNSNTAFCNFNNNGGSLFQYNTAPYYDLLKVSFD